MNKRNIIKETLVDEKRTPTLGVYNFNINGIDVTKYFLAKPLNDNKKYRSFFNRIKDAIEIIKGRGIMVKYFEDFTREEQEEYINTCDGHDAGRTRRIY